MFGFVFMITQYFYLSYIHYDVIQSEETSELL